jgi:Na+/H+ antiporter NhaA
MLLGPAMVIFMFIQANEKIGIAAEGVQKLNTTLQWAIILIIFIPVCFGMVIFGYYGIKGEYDHLPESSKEITD